MMTDTGSFQYNGVNSKTHQIIAELINKEIIQSEIYNKVYNENSTSKLMILGKALNNLNVLKEYKTTYMYLKRDELKEHNYEKGDTEGVVNYGLSLKNIEFTAMFIEDLEDENLIKISFRSKNKFPCNKFAKDNFNGGGHINAAGGKFEGKIYNAIALFKKKIKEFKFH
jgi:phosphoesterase RecJ-like protein